MEPSTMGRIVVAATVENLKDRHLLDSGYLRAEEARSLTIEEALIDTGATNLSLPKRLIDQLGLQCMTRRPVRTASGRQQVNIYDAVRLSVQGRDCVVDVTELPDDCPPLIGQVPLELMDWVIDPKRQCLVGNPAHGGEWMHELY